MKKITFNNRGQEFHATLKKRVAEYFKENNISPNANTEMVFKTIILIAFFIFCYGFLVFGKLDWYWNVFLSVLMGLVIAGIGFNIMHDAAHGSYSKNKLINTLLSYSLDLIGGSSWFWKTKHNVVHHTYTNITEIDDDVNSGKILRLTTQQPLLKIHKWQHIYSWFLYSLLSISWIFYADFKKAITRKVMNYPIPRPNKKTLIAIWVFKILYFGYAIFLPIYVTQNIWGVIGCYLLINLVLGFVLSVIFQMAHMYDGTSFPEPNPETNKIENEWAKHQFETTANFAPRSKILNWYTGGLNHQVEHHLFPHICHIHYPKIAPILKQTCKEYGVPYYEFPTFSKAIQSHIRHLKRMGNPEKYKYEPIELSVNISLT
ncbi:MAG: acyl-CoA desaturase [Bacteroidia bacterium]|nr:acyl-CoA desaturase [Bacteroidia bacterium]MDW8346865.1 acyl-CoA desaturase [Bacteroidia bacterium]